MRHLDPDNETPEVKMDNFDAVEYSDYVIYADESGDHSMNDSNQLYPMFVVAFCVFSKSEYIEVVVSKLKKFKFSFWGHDMVILHSSKLRKRLEQFCFLNEETRRATFLESLNGVINESPFSIITKALDKRSLGPGNPSGNPYEICLEQSLHEICQFLEAKNQRGKLTHVIIESRGKKEDRDLEIAFQKIIKSGSFMERECALELVFADKKTNSIGLQIADLVAYPIGRHLINPQGRNPAFELIEKKIYSFPSITVSN